MRLRFLVVLLLAGFGPLAAQNLQISFPQLENLKESQVPFGSKISVTITNNGSEPATFFLPFQHPDTTIDPYWSFSGENHINYMLNSRRADTTMWIKDMIQADAKLLKSDLFMNEGYADRFSPAPGISPAAHENIESKSINLGALLSTPVTKCGHHVNFLLTDLRHAGVPSSAFKVDYFNTAHIFSRIEVSPGQWAVVDPDPGMKFLHGPGYEDIAALHNNTAILNDANQYRFIDLQGRRTGAGNWFNYADWATYNQIFDASLLNETSFDVVALPYQMSGGITLGPKCSLIFEYEHNTYVIDTATTAGRDVYTAFVPYYNIMAAANWSDYTLPAADSIKNILGAYLGIDPADAMALLLKRAIEFSDGKWYQHIRADVDPVVKYVVVPRSEPYLIGTDIAFPTWVKEVSLSAGDSVLLNNLPGDELLVTNTTGFDLLKVFPSPPTEVQDQDVHFLNGAGGVVNRDTVIFTQYINPRILNVLVKNLTVDQLGVPDTLDFTFKSDIIALPVSVKEVYNHKDSAITLYPNPAKNTTVIKFEKAYTGTLTISNIAGKVIDVKKINAQSEYRLDVSRYAAGTYIINASGLGNTGAKLIKL